MTKLKSFTLAIALAFAAFAAAPSSAFAVAEVNVAPGKTLLGPGVAVHGYDTVAYFTQGKPTLGSAKFSKVHNNATYRFANAENLKTFEANPDKYVPAYGGFCAFGVSVGAKFDGDPRLWKIVDGKLYLNLNEEIQKTWLEDIPGNITKANEAWKRIEHSDPEQLS